MPVTASSRPTPSRFTGSDGDVTNVTLPIQQQLDGSTVSAGSAPVPVATADPKLSAGYGIPAGIKLSGVVATRLTSYQITNAWGRGCFDAAISSPGGTVRGVHVQRTPLVRWGQRITTPDPHGGNDGGTVAASNAGHLTGVNTVQTWHTFLNTDNGWRTVEATLGAAIRAADYQGLLGHYAGDSRFSHRRHPQRAGSLPGQQPGRRLGYSERGRTDRSRVVRYPYQRGDNGRLRLCRAGAEWLRLRWIWRRLSRARLPRRT